MNGGCGLPTRQALEHEASRLIALGYVVHPIARKGVRHRDRHGAERVTTGKGPIIPGWQRRSLSEAELLRELGNPIVSGLGFRACAERTVLDFDGEGHRGAYEYVLSEFLEFEDAPLVRTGSGKEHLHFASPGMPEIFTNQKFSRPDLKVVVELRGNRSNCVLPPTIHPETGLPYCWERDPEDFRPPEIPFRTIHDWLRVWAGVPASGTRTERVASEATSRLPIGRFARDFFERGWPLGSPYGISQRDAVLRVTRNLLSAGWPVDDTVEAVWAAIERSPWDEGKGPWTREDITAIVVDLAQRRPPPLRAREAVLPSRPSVVAHRSGLRVIPLAHAPRRIPAMPVGGTP